MISFYLIILFTDTGVSQHYTFADKASCEQVKPAVMQLYNGLKQPVSLSCVPKVESLREKESSVKISYKVKTSYKF